MKLMRQNDGRQGGNRRRRFAQIVVATMAGLVLAGSVTAAAPKPKDSLEARIKAVVLTKVLLFVDLDRRHENGEELTIAIFGSSDLEPHLEEAFEGFGERYGRLRIQEVHSLADLTGADVVFVPGGSAVDICALVRQARAEGALTVTDSAEGTNAGVMIGLIRDRNRVTIRVNNEEAQAAGVRISSKLLQLASVVRTTSECE